MSTPFGEDSGIRIFGPFEHRFHDMPIPFPDRRKQQVDTSKLRLFGRRLWSLIAESDTTPTKFLLAATASLWCLLLLLPGDSLSRPVYFYLSYIAGENPDEKWAVAWALYAGMMWWRIFALPGQHKWLPMLINIYGVLIFSTIPVCFFMQRLYPFPVGSGPYVALALAAIWVAARTNVNTVKGWRGD